jgi:hypothetical protein
MLYRDLQQALIMLVDPIFSVGVASQNENRQHQTFTDLFWLSNYLWQLILKDMDRVKPFIL